MKQEFLFLAITLLSFLTTQNAHSAPASNKPIVIEQADGTTITITINGDEWVHWTSTTDHYRIIKNKEGIYEYATLVENKIETSGVKASDPDKRDDNELQHLSSLQKNLGVASDKLKSTKRLYVPSELKATTSDNGFPSIGNNKYLVILANFSDQTTSVTQNEFNNYMNQVNYNGTGSFRDFYLENSNNKLDITSTVTAWVTLPQTHDYYADKNGSFSFDAVKAAHDAGIDFSQFDNNNDGYVDGIAIIHQGKGQETSGDPTDIWSHSHRISWALYFENDNKYTNVNELTFDGVIVDSYTTQPELANNTTNTIGVICHEFGHALGAYDYYDTDYSENGKYPGTGNWDLMAGGSYNGNPAGSTPAHMNCFEKYYRGWISIETLETPGSKTLEPSINSQHIYRVNTNTRNEYFLLENKIHAGFDSYLPGEGMLIYHVDEDYVHGNKRTVNASAHQGMYPIIAGNASFGPNTSGCTFPGSSNNTYFTDLSTPSSKSWDATQTEKPITDISIEGENINFTFISALNTVVFTTKINDTPLSNVEISFNNSTTETDAQGLASFSAPIGEVLSYTITKEHYEPISGNITVQETANNIEINLEQITTGINSLKAGDIKVYPNPSANGKFTVTLPENNSRFKVYSTTGRILTMGDFTSAESTLSLPNNIAGVYIIQIEMSSKVYTGRLVVK